MTRDDDQWRLYALCREYDSSMWFPPHGTPLPQINAAKAICATCPVKHACLEAGMDEHYGIWGGTSETERRILRRLRARSSAA